MALPELREMRHAATRRKHRVANLCGSAFFGQPRELPALARLLPVRHWASVFQSASSLDSNCLPPLWKALRPPRARSA